MQPPHQLPSGGAVVDPKQQIPAHVWRRSLVQRAALDVVELEPPGSRRCDRHSCPREKCSGGVGGSAFGGARYGNVRDPGLVAWSTPSRITGPSPPFTIRVKNVSMTSSLSARPPHVSCWREARCASSISRKLPLSWYGFPTSTTRKSARKRSVNGCFPSPSGCHRVAPSRPSQKARFAFNRAR